MSLSHCVSPTYLANVSDKNFDKYTFKALYYLGWSYYKGDKCNETNLKQALKAFEILLQKFSAFPEYVDDPDMMDDVAAVCQELNNKNNSKTDEIKCRSKYCIGLFSYKKKKYEEAIRAFEEYLHMLNYLTEEQVKKVLQYTTIKVLYYKGLSHYYLDQHYESANSYFSLREQFGTSEQAYDIHSIMIYWVHFGAAYIAGINY